MSERVIIFILCLDFQLAFLRNSPSSFEMLLGFHCIWSVALSLCLHLFKCLQPVEVEMKSVFHVEHVCILINW